MVRPESIAHNHASQKPTVHNRNNRLSPELTTECAGKGAPLGSIFVSFLPYHSGYRWNRKCVHGSIDKMVQRIQAESVCMWERSCHLKKPHT